MHVASLLFQHLNLNLHSNFSFSPVLQLVYMDLHRCKCDSVTNDINYMCYMADPLIVKVCGAILISTIAMSTLEPCLPIWLMETLKPEVCILNKFNGKWFKFKFVCQCGFVTHKFHYIFAEMANWNSVHTRFDWILC